MLDGIQDMDGYLRAYGPALAERIKEQAKPLFSPGDPWDDRLYRLLKRPYQAQGDAIMGLCRLLDDYDSAIVVGEMGCGKTLIGLAVPYVQHPRDRPARTLVMCPGHLVRKWQREAKETIPHAEARIVRHLGDVLDLDRASRPDAPEYFIVSKDRAKLGYAWRPAVVESRDIYHCPTCHAPVLDRNGVPADYGYLSRNKRRCGRCDAPLWEADNTRIRRYPIAEYIKKHLRGYFDFLIADEVHELKGGDTAQGNAFGALASACRKTLALTGTLLGGYADDVFYVLYRLSPQAMQEDGLDYRQVTGWLARYGVLEKVTKYYPADNVFSKGKRGRTVVRRKPGVSPAVFSRHLLDKTVFLSLDDVAPDLPPISEEVTGVEMGEELGHAYEALEDELSSAVRDALAQGDKTLLGTYVNALLSYPDRPFDNAPLVHPRTGEVIAQPAELPRDRVYQKEQKLLELVRESVSEGRRVFCYAQYTGIRDVTARLQELLMDEGIEAQVLRYSVPPEKREEWLRNQVESGAQVVIANPKLVQTGLDLYDFPTLAFYQTGYSVYSLRQASRRSWRIGQDKDVRVHYLYYRPTMQERAMHLMGSKLQASLAVEGKFSEEGLLAMTQGEDMATALARALVDGLEGEGVEEIWHSLNKKNLTGGHEGTRGDGLLFYIDPVGAAKRTKRRSTRRKRAVDAGQMGLFPEL